MKKYRCTICGYIYDEEKEKIKFEDLPDDWTCPLCGAPKNLFIEVNEESNNENKETTIKNSGTQIEEENDLRELSKEEIRYICSNLAKSCEKQYLTTEQDLFNSLSNYFDRYITNENGTIEDLINLYNQEIDLYQKTLDTANAYDDGGSKRVITWASKVSAIVRAILNNYQEKGMEYLKNTKIWVCDICGFVYIGNNPSEVCPVCKVPSIKIMEVK